MAAEDPGTGARKAEHLQINLEEQVGSRELNGFADWRFVPTRSELARNFRKPLEFSDVN